MYKVVWIARYRKDMTKQEASDHWATLHGPPMKQVSPVAGYVQSHVQGPLPAVSGVAARETLFDGYSCAWWNDRARYHHGPIFKELDIDRYVQNHVAGPIGEEGETDDAEIGFDGFSECWFRAERQFRAAVESARWATAVEDAHNVFDMTQMWGAVLKENVVIAPQLVGA